ncbi:hypothetical protein SUDANB95_00570 [Actinosynnema sp. ALI-1.44]
MVVGDVVLDELVGLGVHDVGGLLWGWDVGGSVVVVSSTGGVVSGGGGWCAGASARGLSGPGTVMTTVEVWPSVAARTAVLVVARTSAWGLGGPASRLASGLASPVANIEARVAMTVATTAPPAASSTTDETLRCGDS